MKYSLLILCTILISGIYAVVFATGVYFILWFIAGHGIKLIIFRASFIMFWIIISIIALSGEGFIMKWLKQRTMFREI